MISWWANLVHKTLASPCICFYFSSTILYITLTLSVLGSVLCRTSNMVSSQAWRIVPSLSLRSYIPLTTVFGCIRSRTRWGSYQFDLKLFFKALLGYHCMLRLFSNFTYYYFYYIILLIWGIMIALLRNSYNQIDLDFFYI